MSSFAELSRPQGAPPETSAATVGAGPKGAPLNKSAATVLGGKSADSRLSVGPTLSPDGEAIAFFSDRSQHSIDMVVADTRTGAVRRKVVKTESDPHFESLQFIESAGAWAPDGRRLAMAALSGGAPGAHDPQRRIRQRGARAAHSTRGSGLQPDVVARRQADRVFGSSQRLQRSRSRSISRQPRFVRSRPMRLPISIPAWSPDGRTIAFSTDRFTSSLETLTFGEFRLASIDVESGTINALPSIPGAKNIDPHWTQDGSSLYFIADADGIEQRLSPRPGRRRDLQGH